MARLAIKVFVLILYYVACCLPSISANRYNVTMAEMDRCVEYDIDNKRGYAYKDFFRIVSLNNNNKASNERLHLKLYVMTTMDAHILLTVTDTPRRDRVYEIVIGGGKDTFSTIRNQMGSFRVAISHERNLFSQYDPTPIEIVQRKDGQLLVYIPGLKEDPLLSYTDPSPLDIQHLSFGTYGSTSAKWFYDCEFDDVGGEIAQEVRQQTPRQHLLDDLAEKGANSSVPVGLESVQAGIQVKSLTYEESSSTLVTRMNLQMDWQDTRLVWDPKEYGNIDAIGQPAMQLWTPAITVLNGRLIFGSNTLIVQSNGSLTLQLSNMEIVSRCVNNRRNWPSEHLTCELALSLDEFLSNPSAPLTLEYSGTPFSHEEISLVSEWQFNALTFTSVENSSLARYSERGIVQAMDGDLMIVFDISHNAYFYKNVFMVPLLASQCLLTLGFALRGYRRGGLTLVVFTILILGLMFAAKRGPHSYVPNLMVAYQHMLRLDVAAYMLHIVIMWLEMYPPNFKPANWLMDVVKSSMFRILCCQGLYNTNMYVRSEQQPWREVAKALNRCSFLIYQVIFIVINVFVLPEADESN